MNVLLFTQEVKYGDSYYNAAEARLICQLIHFLLQFTATAEQQSSAGPFRVGVICMYKPQCYEIKKQLSNNAQLQSLADRVMVSTVDAFQGMEMDIVVIATTRQICTQFLW